MARFPTPQVLAMSMLENRLSSILRWFLVGHRFAEERVNFQSAGNMDEHAVGDSNDVAAVSLRWLLVNQCDSVSMTPLAGNRVLVATVFSYLGLFVAAFREYQLVSV
jgi:hypothetical protein